MDDTHREGLKARLGRRGAILLSYGSLWLMFAYVIFTMPEQDAVDPLGRYLPSEARASMWLVTGLTAVLFAFAKNRSDTPGYLALYLMPTLMFLSYMAAWFFYLNGDPLGFKLGWLQAVSYISLSIPIIVCGGWAEPITKDDLR